MYKLGAIFGGLIGGAVGAAIWAAVAAFTGYEIGWIAWGIGILVGVGVAIGNKGEGSTAAGVMAAVLAAMSVAGGKYAMVQMILPDESELVSNSIEALQDNELVVSYIADDVVAEFEDEGQTLQWPEEAEPYNGAGAADYPGEVWTVAQARWDAMSPVEQEEFKAQLEANIAESAAAFREVLANQGFFYTFGLMDIIFFALAVVTAFKIGSAGSMGGSEASEA